MAGSNSPIRLKWALSLAVGIVVLAGVVRLNADAYAVPSSSMVPTLLSGDHLLVTRLPTRGPDRGDVIVFYEASQQTTMVKRVIGLPGDSVDLRQGQVFINGTRLTENYVRPPRPDSSSQIHVVPSGHFFLLGDNRDHSEDSRAFGFVPRGSILGKARMVYWSIQPRGADHRAGVRWSRILQRVD